jgi:hypothetical protein
MRPIVRVAIHATSNALLHPPRTRRMNCPGLPERFRQAGSNVGPAQRGLWLGHGKRDATSWYETHDREFLRECAEATTQVIEKLNRLTQRDLIARGPDQMNSRTTVVQERSEA